MVRPPEDYFSLFPEEMAEQYSDREMPDTFLRNREKFLSLVDEGRILDAGCGHGRDTEFFVENGFEATGIDVAEGMIDFARENRKGVFQTMDMRSVGFEDSSFDGVWCCASIYYLSNEDKKKALQEFKRILKKGGVLYLDFKVGEGEKIGKRQGEKVKEYRIGKEEGRKLLENQGFKILDSSSNKSVSGENTFYNAFCEKQ